MKYLVFLSLHAIFCALTIAQTSDLHLDLPIAPAGVNKNVFNLELSPYIESKLLEISGQKLEIPSDEISYNGISAKVKSCKTRGKSTLHFKRKSFSISFIDPIIIGGKEISKLALNNLVMDRNYYRNRLSFLLMDRLDIFHLQNEFAELRINGNSAGLYLAIQKPEDYSRSMESSLLARREYEGRFTIEDAQGENTKIQMKRLKSIPKLSKNFEGKQLYDSLNAVVHMDHYFQWLAFNFLIKNGDYTDELFLYLTADEQRFDIIPWDYDDIFNSQPHDGFVRRNKVLDHKLIFSGEAYLDIVIDSDKFLYLEFLSSFMQVLEVLNPLVLKESFEKVYLELFPYFTDQEIIALSEYDHYGPTDQSTLMKDLQTQFQDILIRRKGIEVIIASELRRLSD